MKNCLVSSVFLFLACGTAVGFPFGPPPNACLNMRPQAVGTRGHTSPFFGELGFQLSLASPTFSPGEEIRGKSQENYENQNAFIYCRIRSRTPSALKTALKQDDKYAVIS